MASCWTSISPTNSVLDVNAQRLASRPVPGLTNGAVFTASTSFRLPIDLPVGAYFVIARAYSRTLGVFEPNEDDNTRTTRLMVGPDVAAVVATGPSGAAPGVPIRLVNGVLNNGTSPATFHAHFYLSTDDVLDQADVYLDFRAIPALPSGATSTVTTTLTVPADTAPGVYRILVHATSNPLGDRDPTNDVRATAPIMVALPDLTVTALTAPTRLAPGETISVSHTVRNGAPAPGAAPASISRVYLSADSVVDAGDVDLGTVTVPALGPGGLASVARTVTIPPGTAPGRYFLLARADDGALVAESDEANNVRAVPVSVGPDLTVTAVNAPVKALQGQTVTVSATVQNVGSALAPPRTSTVAFYLSTHPTLGVGRDVRLGARTIGGLAAGASTLVSTAGEVPQVGGGPYFLIARADDVGVIDEAREDNNTRASSAVIAVGSDVAVTAAAGPATAYPGARVTVAYTVANFYTSGPRTLTIGFYLSTDEVLDSSDVFFDFRHVDNLAAGHSVSAAPVLTIPHGVPAGTYRILVRMDEGMELDESNEANNVRATGPIVIIGPDLAATGLTAPPTASARTPFWIAHTVRNAGAGRAVSSVSRFYLSTDDVLDGADVELATLRVPALDPGVGATLGQNVRIALDTPPGPYFIIARVNDDGLLSDSDGGNNTTVLPIVITPSGFLPGP
jgi:hypothetical protein